MTFTLNWESDGFLPQFALVAQTDKNLPAMWETWVQSLGWEDALVKGTATHSSILAWRIPWTEGTRGYSPWHCKELDVTDQLSTHTHNHRKPFKQKGTKNG